MRRTPVVILAVAVTAALLATAAPASAKRTVVRTHHGALGTYLVDRAGRTLYLFEKDTSRRSRCNGTCAAAWPPLIAHGRPKAKGHARHALLRTGRRRDGRRQVTYDGHPLYRYAGDAAPGQTNGQGLDAFGALWFVVAPSGHEID